jgi:hypothetical protein
MISRLWRRIEGFDLDFRPRSYFWPMGLREHLLATVKGTLRRELIALLGEREALADEAVAGILARERISEPLRRALGRIHPAFMSGEYLPDLRRGELEIARVTVGSVMGDVTSVRARRTKKGIAYRIEDEHETEYEARPRWSREPLSMLELIRLIENAKPASPTLGVLKMNREGGSEWDDLEGFVEVTSPFYPQLGAWYERYLGLWIASRSGRLRTRPRVRRPHPGQLQLAFAVAGADAREERQ